MQKELWQRTAEPLWLPEGLLAQLSLVVSCVHPTVPTVHQLRPLPGPPRSSLLQEGTCWLSGGEVWVLRAACCLLSPYALDTEDRAAATHHPLQSEPDWSKAAQGGPFPPTGACSTLAASQWLQPSGGALDPAALALTSSILTSPASPAH